MCWEVSVTLESSFCLSALDWALRIAQPEIFNSDQGSQFTSNDFTGRLLAQGILISMDGRGRALDNISLNPMFASGTLVTPWRDGIMSFRTLTDRRRTKSCSPVNPMREIGNRPEARNRQFAIRLILRCVVLPALCAFTASDRILAQSKAAESEALPLCSRSNAIDSIRQQIDLTKTIDDSTRRIAVLIRAADLLWSVQQEKARAVFTEAFELATRSEKENELSALTKKRRNMNRCRGGGQGRFSGGS